MRAAEGWQTPVSVEMVPDADAIVVLTGMLQRLPGEEPHYEWNDAVDRFEGGVTLLGHGKAPRLILTGGWVPWRAESRPEGDVLAERAVALGIPRERIVVTGRASNTDEESAAVASALGSPSASGTRRRIILVTSAFHMRRARIIFEHAGFEVLPYPTDFRTDGSPTGVLDFLPSADALRNSETALREFYGYLFYRIVG